MSTLTRAKTIHAQKTMKRQKTKKELAKAAEIAKVASKVVNKKLRNDAELKFHVEHNVNTVLNTGFVSILSDPTTGNTDETKVGDKITMKSLRLNYIVSNGDAINFVRVCIFQFTDSNNPGNPTVASCLQNVAYPIVSPWNHDNVHSKKYKVLYDKVHFLSEANNASNIASVTINKGFNRNLQFEGGGPSAVGHLYIMVISDSGAAPSPAIEYYSKLQYTDL